MMFPPSIMRIHVGERDKGFRLWLPIFLLWPIVLLAALLLAPMAPNPPHRTHHKRGSVATALRKRWKPLLTMYVFVVVRGIVQLIFVTFLPLYLIDSGMSNIRDCIPFPRTPKSAEF